MLLSVELTRGVSNGKLVICMYKHIYIINYPYQNYSFFFTMNLAKLDWPFTLIDFLFLYGPLFLPF